MARDTCGAKSGSLVCDRAPHVDGEHRGYDEAHDSVLFWPTTTKRLQHLEDQIVALLEELDTDPPARSAAIVRLRLAMRRPTSTRARA
jgi:hypothetical protein